MSNLDLWFSGEATPSLRCKICDKRLDAGLVYAMEHWADCVGEEGVREATKKAMIDIGYTSKEADDLIYEIGL